MTGRSIRLIAVAAGLCLLLLGGWTLYHYDVLPSALRMHCIIFEVAGLYCPGCGASRACYSILHGDWRAAAGYNVLLVVLLPIVAVYIIMKTIDWMITGINHIDSHIPDKVLYGLLGVVIVYGILRNIPIWPLYLFRP